MATEKPEANSVAIETFTSWGKGDIVSMKAEDKNGRTMLTFAWCKLCARHKNAIFSSWDY